MVKQTVSIQLLYKMEIFYGGHKRNKKLNKNRNRNRSRSWKNRKKIY